MKSIFFGIVLALSVSHANEAPEALIRSLKRVGDESIAGNYTHKKIVRFGVFPKKEACLNQFYGAEWNSETQECYGAAVDSVIVEAVADRTYSVTLDVSGNNLAGCNYSGILVRRGNSLIFPENAEGPGKFELQLSENMILVKDNGYADANCGHNANIDGRVFIK